MGSFAESRPLGNEIRIIAIHSDSQSVARSRLSTKLWPTFSRVSVMPETDGMEARCNGSKPPDCLARWPFRRPQARRRRGHIRGHVDLPAERMATGQNVKSSTTLLQPHHRRHTARFLPPPCPAAIEPPPCRTKKRPERLRSSGLSQLVVRRRNVVRRGKGREESLPPPSLVQKRLSYRRALRVRRCRARRPRPLRRP